MPKNKRKKKILAVNFGGIGDEILFLPTLKTLKSSFPNSEITLALEPRSKSIEKLTKLVDNCILCDVKGKNKYIELVKFLFTVWKRRYDLLVISGSSKMVAMLAFLTGISKKYGYYSGGFSKFVFTKAVPLNQQQYAANMYHDLTSFIVDREKPSAPEIDIDPESLVFANKKIGKRNHKKIITIHPGVSKLSIKKNIIKFWDTEKWAELAVRLIGSGKYRVLFAGGPDDKHVFEELRAELAQYDIDNEDLIDLYGQTKDISQLAAIISLSDLLVSVDSAPMHIGVGVRTPLVAIFGPTDEKKLLPLDDNRFIAVVDDKKVCRPCLWDKRQTSCEFVDCLNITVDKVIESIESVLD